MSPPHKFNEEMWQQHFQRLVEYQQSHGCFPPHSDQLGNWLAKQRMVHRKGELSEARQRCLGSIAGFEWGDEDRWQQQFERLVEYHRSHGRFPSDRADKLGGWLCHQRQAYRRGKMSEARQRRLDSIGGLETEPREALWERRFQELVVFKAHHGHCHVPRSHSPQLQTWANKQRANRAAGVLSEERFERLNEIELEWRTKKQKEEQEENEVDEREDEAEGGETTHGDSLLPAARETNSQDLEELRELLTETRKDLARTKQTMAELERANAAAQKQLQETQTAQAATRKDLSETKQTMADLEIANAATKRKVSDLYLMNAAAERQLEETRAAQAATRKDLLETKRKMADWGRANAAANKRHFC